MSLKKQKRFLKVWDIYKARNSKPAQEGEEEFKKEEIFSIRPKPMIVGLDDMAVHTEKLMKYKRIMLFVSILSQ